MRDSVPSALAVDTCGGVSIGAAFAMTMLVGGAALAVDLGALYLDRRELQGIADAAALAAAAAPDDAPTAARRLIDANCRDCGIAIGALVHGSYTADGAVAAEQRFAAGGESPNAVRLTLTRERPLTFARFLTGRDTAAISATATGARRAYAAFSLGSRVAAVHGGVPNAILSALAGSELGLSVMDYEALASADVDLLAFSDALRTRAGVDALTFGETLDASATLPEVAGALADATTDGAVAAALEKVAANALPRSIVPSSAIDLGPRASNVRIDAASPVNVNALDLLRAMLILGGGGRQLDLSLASDLPGGSGVDVALLVGEPPADSPLIAITDDDQVVVRTAQVRLKLGAKIATPLATVELPLVAELGSAAARLSAIDCSRGASSAVTLGVTTSPATVAIGKVDSGDFQDMNKPLAPKSAKLLSLPLASVSGKAELILSDLNEKPVGFSRIDIDDGTVKTVESSGLVAGAAASLADRIDLDVNLLGIGINAGALTSLVGTAVASAAPVLDGLLESVTGALGVHVGEADARVNALRCGHVRLV